MQLILINPNEVQKFPKSSALLPKMNTEKNDNDRVSDQFNQLIMSEIANAQSC